MQAKGETEARVTESPVEIYFLSDWPKISVRSLMEPVLSKEVAMANNRGVAYVGPGRVEVKSIEYPKLKMPKSETDPFGGKDAPHGVILKIITTNICGSDQHMVRGRTTAPAGLILGHEITGEVIEKGNDVEMLNVGDLVTVPFNIRL
jgi:glutathione-independent formaldehyde dehydrogenase